MRARLQKKLQHLVGPTASPLIISYILNVFTTSSGPALVMEAQNQKFVVKGAQIGQSIVAEHVVGHLGVGLGAPVGYPYLLELSPDLIELNPEIGYFQPGLVHGVPYLEHCFDERDIRHYCKRQENRLRFALLALLYGWCAADDHQFLFGNATPNHVYSVDHGHFLGGSRGLDAVMDQRDSVEFDAFIAKRCKFSPSETSSALACLARMTEDDILRAVAQPPGSWGITMEERVDLAEYLLIRREAFLSDFIPDLPYDPDTW